MQAHQPTLLHISTHKHTHLYTQYGWMDWSWCFIRQVMSGQTASVLYSTCSFSLFNSSLFTSHCIINHFFFFYICFSVPRHLLIFLMYFPFSLFYQLIAVFFFFSLFLFSAYIHFMLPVMAPWSAEIHIFIYLYIYILPLSCFGFILTSLLRYYSFLKCPFPSLAPAEVRWAPELLFIFVFIIRTAFFSWSWLTSRRFEVTLCLYDFVWFLAWSLFMWSLHVFSVPACVSSGSSGLWM